MKHGWLVLKEILRGAGITARHFTVNMWHHTLRLFGIRTKRAGAVTFQYPEVVKPLAPRHKSRHRILRREDGSPQCVACMMCATVCPSECIYIEAAETDDPEVQKFPASFVVDLNRCCFCGFCVEACPVDAIRMDTGEIRLASTARAGLEYPLDKLLG
jgi:NADH-quinone oxidoreductase subunit I